jgi:hypothetical protein
VTRIAAWLLRTFGSGSKVDTLIGDLTEEYRAGKSALWFWGQAMLGIVATFVAEVRAHKLLTLRAVVTALVLMFILTNTIGYFRPWFRAATEVYLPTQEPYVASTYSIVNGAKVPGTQQIPVSWHTYVYLPVILLALNVLGALMIGAFVRRTHRLFEVASILASAAALILFAVGQRLYIQSSIPEGVPLIEAGWWMASSLWIVGTAVAFMLGGLGGHGWRREPPSVRLAADQRPGGAV